MQDLAQLTLDELSKMISDAQKALDARKISERKAVIGQIHELAASIGVTVTIQGEKTRGRISSRKGQKVAPKYKNPNNSSETWTGRGVKPRWLKALVDAGKRIEDFLI
ncbi:MAG: H-NS histone family protein [Gammaproteobacteria bacterium]|nr:H-NS histone family protein [Gammaproteobacteria bacterium]NBT43313.1 H-NS histone family protein [Gammaproteobacteria bacterium]NBY21375.1 H-NS histone family protein [Gammaproteobacteria bacterium]